MLRTKAKILYNKKIKGDYFLLGIRQPRIAKESSPGQFLNIKVNDAYEPLLRRPLSIHRVSGSDIEIFYEVVGQATQILSQRKPAEYLDIIGPLGNGFKYQAQTAGRRPQVLVSGGMGVAPLVFLAQKLAKPRVLIGAKTKSRILCEKEFENLGCDVKLATDDGSKGFKGYVCALLNKELSAMKRDLPAIYACGPRLMLKEVSRISEKYNITAQVSLEEHMACGIGACLGCAVNTKKGFKRVCKDGPVFNADEIIW